MLSTKMISAALKDRPETGQRVLRDTEVPGLMLVIGKKRATWTVEAMSRGKRQKITIGNTGTHALDEARTAARNLKDSLHTQTPAQAADAVKRELAADVPCRTRLEEHLAWMQAEALGPKSILAAKCQVTNGLEAIDMMDRPPSDLTTQHLLDIIEKAPAKSRKARYGYVSRFMKWCSSRGYTKVRFATIDLEDNDKPAQLQGRDRVLAMEELRLVLDVLRQSNSMDPAIRDLIRFLILIPARRGEAARSKCKDVNLTDKYLEIAGRRSKNKLPHRFPLPPAALAIVKRNMGEPTDYLFPSPKTKGEVQGWSKIKVAIDNALPEGFEPWVIHDLRRTCASHLADARVDETVVDLILNHKAAGSRGGVKGVYIKAARWDERVEALKKWDAMVTKIGGAK